jgi:dihydrofolate reductase
MSINLIAAIDLNRGLGFKNDLLTKLPNDLKHFKELTTGQFIVMGRKTYESIGHPLPQRHNIIVSRDPKFKEPTGTYVYNSLTEVIHEYKQYNNSQNELFIIGGAEIYDQALEYVDRLYLTVIDHYFKNVDTFFPPFSLLEWMVIENKENKADVKNPYDHYFLVYERRNNTK